MRKKQIILDEFAEAINKEIKTPADVGRLTRLREEYKRDHVQADSFCGECESKPTIDCEFH